MEESLPLVAKIILGVHDEAKDKPLEVELGYISAGSKWIFTQVAPAQRDAAVAAAKEIIEREDAEGDADEAM